MSRDALTARDGFGTWEYDYALGKNLLRPLTFVYSWFSKFRTILASYGLAGSMRLLRKVLSQRGEE
jgi:hypothetical protein